MKDHYDVLGISSDATQEEIKKAYREKVRFWHPDRNKSKEAHERIVEINKAYEILGNPEERRYYDFYISNSTHSSQQEHTYAAYEPPPYQPKEESFRQERKSKINWGNVIIFSILAFPLVFAFILKQKLKTFENTTKVPQSTIFDYDVFSFEKKIDLDNIEIKENKKSKPFYVAYFLQNGTILKYNKLLTSRLNESTLKELKAETINTIIVYTYVFGKNSEDGKTHFFNVKIFFIDPKDFKIFKIKVFKNNSRVSLPSPDELRSFIQKH